MQSRIGIAGLGRLPLIRSQFNIIRLQSTQSTPTATFNKDNDIATQDIKPRFKSLDAIYEAPLRLPIEHGDLIADIQIRSFEHRNLDFYGDFIQRVGYYLGIPLTGPKPLPTRRERWTVIRSPFVHAKSKENFERHTHKRLLRVWDTNSEVLELFISYIKKHAVAGVGMKCNVYKREPIEIDFENTDNEIKNLTNNKTTEDDLVNSKIMELLNSPEFKK